MCTNGSVLSCLYTYFLSVLIFDQMYLLCNSSTFCFSGGKGKGGEGVEGFERSALHLGFLILKKRTLRVLILTFSFLLAPCYCTVFILGHEQNCKYPMKSDTTKSRAHVNKPESGNAICVFVLHCMQIHTHTHTVLGDADAYLTS